MKLTREEALRLHRQMWGDMKAELGDNPSGAVRILFKKEWRKKHFPGDSMADLIDRQAAIDALKNDMASLDHIIKGMSAYDVRLDAYVSQRNQVNCDIDTISNLPPVQPELGTNLAELGTDCISRQAAIDAVTDELDMIDHVPQWVFDRLEGRLKQLPPAQPEPCYDAVSRKDCLKALSNMMDTDGFRNGWAVSRANVECMLKSMPPVMPKQPDLSEAYANAVFTWLMSYQIQSAQLKGRYTPYEVIGWVLNDWRKEHDAERDT